VPAIFLVRAGLGVIGLLAAIWILVVAERRRVATSLLVAEGRPLIYVAGQLGPHLRPTLDTYGQEIDELQDRPQLPADDATAQARKSAGCAQNVRSGPEAMR